MSTMLAIVVQIALAAGAGAPRQDEATLRQRIQQNPTVAENYFALSEVLEKAARYGEAESVLIKARDAIPANARVYQELASFYVRTGKFDKAVSTVEQRIARDPRNAELHYALATVYWLKAFRDRRLSTAETRRLALKGIAAADAALAINPQYVEALVYKSLLLRIQASTEKTQAAMSALIKQADALRDRAKQLGETRKNPPPKVLYQAIM